MLEVWGDLEPTVRSLRDTESQGGRGIISPSRRVSTSACNRYRREKIALGHGELEGSAPVLLYSD